ncbi:MAG TPA: ABC transporter ATP-binding protein [Vicinamibacterales bacterium]|nr:ABC transporter ATP-binding protein [Vicinamibacterales bacterium]
MAFIEISGVSKSFATGSEKRNVLTDVSLTIERGEFVSIVGMMGCGKSTFLKIVAGLLSPDTGRVAVNGLQVRGVQPNAAIVFQNYSLLPWFSALENVRLAVGAAFPDWTKDHQREQASRHLEAVGLGKALHRRPSQLSGGMRQRVAIARAFATEPEILFLDEPFGALDALTRESLQQELVRLSSTAERPVTTLMITNSVEEALLLSDRIVPMTRGAHPLGHPVRVELRRPRTPGELMHDDHAAHVRAHVVSSLTRDLKPTTKQQVA